MVKLLKYKRLIAFLLEVIFTFLFTFLLLADLGSKVNVSLYYASFVVLLMVRAIPKMSDFWMRVFYKEDTTEAE